MTNADPLLCLLKRYLAERNTFDADDIPDTDLDKLARTTWYRTQEKIISCKPRATTAAGALLALDFVLGSEELFADRSESEDLQLLWLLVKAARDYIKVTCVSR